MYLCKTLMKIKLIKLVCFINFNHFTCKFVMLTLRSAFAAVEGCAAGPSLKNCLQLPTRGLKVWVGRLDFFLVTWKLCSIYFV